LSSCKLLSQSNSLQNRNPIIGSYSEPFHESSLVD
jgi:hypothetical protein